MANVKQWEVREVFAIGEYLSNTVATNEVVLRLRNRKGVRQASYGQEVELAVKALRLELGKFARRCGGYWDSPSEKVLAYWLEEITNSDGSQEPLIEFEQIKLNQAFEDWIAEYLVEGGRAKLLNALRVREHRSQSEPAASKPAKPAEPVDRVAQLVKVLRKYSEDEVNAALALVGRSLR